MPIIEEGLSGQKDADRANYRGNTTSARQLLNAAVYFTEKLYQLSIKLSSIYSVWTTKHNDLFGTKKFKPIIYNYYANYGVPIVTGLLV